ncbi:LexA family transcriptional regulator [Campylobacter concisus]|uniref:LexA family transcriptional regulator n=1 Tax=Campylobacter concisus TaxID=199 RepID=UPI000CD88DAB|nr:LexA family transcriptional regulator [Campylobacter concisus]
MAAEEVLDRIYEIVGVKNRNQLSQKIGKTPSTIAGWIERDKVPMDILYKIADEYNTSMDFLLDGIRKNEYQSNEVVNGYWIKKLNQKVGAGTSVDITEVDVIDEDDKFFVPATFFKTIMKNEKLRMAQVDGYSMVPMLHPDNWVIFEKTKEFKGDGLYVIMYNDNLMVKILQKTPRGNLYIKSTNKDYESFELDENTCGSCQIIGKVIKCII